MAARRDSVFAKLALFFHCLKHPLYEDLDCSLPTEVVDAVQAVLLPTLLHLTDPPAGGLDALQALLAYLSVAAADMKFYV